MSSKMQKVQLYRFGQSTLLGVCRWIVLSFIAYSAYLGLTDFPFHRILGLFSQVRCVILAPLSCEAS
jgi:hypothetical protein